MNRSQHLEHMIQTQLIEKGICSSLVLKAMRQVDRALFVSKEQQRFAYHDTPLPIGNEQTISQPYIVAYMTEALDLRPGMRVLEIGTGSGYQTAILAACGAKVFTIEYIQKFSEKARQRLNKLGFTDIEYKTGSGFNGWKEHAPYERIIGTCAPFHIPAPLVNQLADGGRMVIPTGKGVQILNLVTKEGNNTIIDELMLVRFVPMVN